MIKNAVGSIRKDEAANLIAEKLQINRKNLIPISLASEYGNPDVLAMMYYYNDIEDARKQLPRYRFLRIMGKDERKKIIDEEKAAKLKAKQKIQSVMMVHQKNFMPPQPPQQEMMQNAPTTPDQPQTQPTQAPPADQPV